MSETISETIVDASESETMRRLALLLSVTFAVGILVGWFAVEGVSGHPEPVKRTVLLRTDLAGMEGQEGVMWFIEIAPGAATGKHYHPGHEFVYVLEGVGHTEVQGKPEATVRAGEAVYLPPGQVTQHEERKRDGSGQGPGRVHWREGPTSGRARAVDRTLAAAVC